MILVGGALNAEREDLLLGYEIGHHLWRGPFKSVRERRDQGGGFIPGSVGAFLMLEARGHAEARSAKAYARLVDVVTGHASRTAVNSTRALSQLFDRLLPSVQAGVLSVWSGASGIEPVTGEELAFLYLLPTYGIAPDVRIYSDELGYSVEAHFFAGLALAALTINDTARHGPGMPKRALTTGTRQQCGEALALIEAIA
jgi:3-oxoacyl-[acyl-carrier-protein] synthase II